MNSVDTAPSIYATALDNSEDTAQHSGVAVKYFFLSDGWTTGRVWEFGGLWDASGWQRNPHMCKLTLCIQEQGETLWLYQVEDAVLMVEVKPPVPPKDQNRFTNPRPIGQVVLKRLITAEQVIQRLCEANSERSSAPPH